MVIVDTCETGVLSALIPYFNCCLFHFEPVVGLQKFETCVTSPINGRSNLVVKCYLKNPCKGLCKFNSKMCTLDLPPFNLDKNITFTMSLELMILFFVVLDHIN